jgi:hypothetical protein
MQLTKTTYLTNILIPRQTAYIGNAHRKEGSALREVPTLLTKIYLKFLVND